MTKLTLLLLLPQPFRCTGRLREMTLPESEKREYGLFLICTPLETMHTSILEIRIGKSLFCTKNRMDLSFMDIDQKYDFFPLLGQDLRYPGSRGFFSPQRDEREREKQWEKTSGWGQCESHYHATRSISKQPIATHLSVSNSQSKYAIRFLQSSSRVRSADFSSNLLTQ